MSAASSGSVIRANLMRALLSSALPYLPFSSAKKSSRSCDAPMAAAPYPRTVLNSSRTNPAASGLEPAPMSDQISSKIMIFCSLRERLQ